MVSRVSTAALNNSTLRYATNTSNEMARLSKQISSEVQYQSYAEMSGKIERVSGFQEKIGKIDNYISGNTTVKVRLNAVSSSISSIQTVASNFLSDLATYNGVSSSSFSLEDSAKSALQQIKDLLNVQIGGRYLFSGSRTNSSPIGDIETPVNTAGVADANYYAGDNQKDTAKISDGFELEYGVTADDPAMQEVISGIRTALQGAQSGDASMVASGQTLVQKSVKTLATLAAKVNLDITSVDKVNAQHTQLKIFWQQSLGEDIDTDVTTATTELKLNETILQASFSAFAKISSLKLTDYLR